MAVTITRTPRIDDDGSGTTGTVINNAEKTSLYNEIDTALAKIPADTQKNIASWVDVPFAAGDFTTPTAGATWVVTSAATWAYIILGKLAVVSLAISNTGPTTGAPVRLQVQLPVALQPNRGSQAIPFTYSVGGVAGTGLCSLQGTKLDLLRDVNGTTYPAGALFLYVTFPFSIA